MKKIGFVIPWYSEKIPGGAEMELRGLTTHLHEAGVEGYKIGAAALLPEFKRIIGRF